MTLHANLQALLRDAVPLPPDARFQMRAAPPAGDEPLEFVMSDDTVDRMGDVIDQAGWQLAHFRRSPVALFNHDRNQVIGRWRDVAVRGGRLTGFLELADEGTSSLVDSIRKLVAQKILRAVSVGFRALGKEKLTEKSDEYFGPFRFTKAELLECSLVSVAANPHALAVAKGMPPEICSIVFGEHAARHGSGLSASTPKPLAQKSTTMTISEKIKAKEIEITGLRDKLAELRKRIEAENRDPTDEESDSAHLLRDEHAAAEAVLGRLRSFEFEIASQVQATPPAVQSPSIVPAASFKKKHSPFDLLVKNATVAYLAHTTRQPVERILAERYRDDREVETFIRTTTAPAMTSVVGWAAELVRTETLAALMETLKPVSIFPRLAAAGVGLQFEGQTPIRIPYRKYGTGTPPPNGLVDAANNRRLSGAFVGEGAPIPVRQGLTASLTLSPYKMAVISVYTREMQQSSTPAIEGIIRDAILEDTAWTLDLSLLSDEAAIAGVRPAGLYLGVTPITAAAAGASAAITDIRALNSAITTAGGGRNKVWIMNPIQYDNLLLQTEAGQFIFRDILGSMNIVQSLNQPAGEVTLIDAADFASAMGAPAFDVSDQATLHMDDGTYPAPANAPTVLPISAAGTPNVVAAPVRSLFQTASVAVRMIMPISWGMRRSGMVQLIQNVNW
jgi:HK97 family phage major capsid protein/HK97 family phage prohead protease